MKEIRMKMIKKINKIWRNLFEMGIISNTTAVVLTHKTVYLLGRKRKGGEQ